MLTQQLLKVTAAGGEWVLWVLIGLSFLSFGTIVDRWWFFRKRKADMETLSRTVLGHLEKGEKKAAIDALAASKAIEAGIVKQCLEWMDHGHHSMEEVLTAALRDHRPILEKGSNLLGTIGNNAPFIGLLGTVLGVVEAFRHLEGGPGGGNMGLVMTSIAEALIATAVGIGVAIPAVIAFNYFGARAARVEERAQSLMNRVLALQKSTRQPGPRRAVGE